MTDVEATVQRYYGDRPVLQRVDDALRAAGVDPERPSHRDLWPFDQLHSRGIAATREHAERARIEPGMHVLEIGQPSGDRCAISIEACKPLADLRLLSADLVQYRRCRGQHGGLRWFQVDRDDQSYWRLTLQCRNFNHRMRRLAWSGAGTICSSAQNLGASEDARFVGHSGVGKLRSYWHARLRSVASV